MRSRHDRPGRSAHDATRASGRKRSAEDGRSQQQPSLAGGQRIDARCDQSVKRVRHVDLDRRPSRCSGAPRAARHLPGAATRPWASDPGRQDPHHLDRVERHAAGMLEDRLHEAASRSGARSQRGARAWRRRTGARGATPVKLPDAGAPRAAGGRAAPDAPARGSGSGGRASRTPRCSTKSSRLGSAHCRSSKTSTAGVVRRRARRIVARRRTARRARMSASRLAASSSRQREARSSVARRRRARARRAPIRAAGGRARASAPSGMRSRRRTICATAENVIPSP